MSDTPTYAVLCRICKQEKAPTEFRRYPRGGCRPDCKTCTHKMNAARNRKKGYGRAYYAENREYMQ